VRTVSGQGQRQRPLPLPEPLRTELVESLARLLLLDLERRERDRGETYAKAKDGPVA
jgi:hypothetical protein